MPAMLNEQKARLAAAFESAARALAEASGDAAAIESAQRARAVLERPKLSAPRKVAMVTRAMLMQKFGWSAPPLPMQP
jgi:peptidoglycan hydrolase CwlO-like protein